MIVAVCYGFAAPSSTRDAAYHDLCLQLLRMAAVRKIQIVWGGSCRHPGWLSPDSLALDKFVAASVLIHTCRFGVPWKWALQLRFAHVSVADIGDLELQCHTTICFASQRPHAPLGGMSSDGRNRSHMAATWPSLLCKRIARIIAAPLRDVVA